MSLYSTPNFFFHLLFTERNFFKRQNLTPLLHAAFLLSISSPPSSDPKQTQGQKLVSSLCIEICALLVENGAEVNVSDKTSKNTVLRNPNLTITVCKRFYGKK